jgi:hypothetical protein
MSWKVVHLSSGKVSRIGVKIREKMLDDEIASTEKEYDCKSKEEPNESGSTD